MSCSGGHLGFPIGIKNTHLVEDHGKNVSKRFFSETTWVIQTKLPRNDHWKVLYKVCVFYADRKKQNFVEDLPMIIPGQFGFNCPSGFREEAF
jgi:hypothetical protein